MMKAPIAERKATNNRGTFFPAAQPVQALEKQEGFVASNHEDKNELGSIESGRGMCSPVSMSVQSIARASESGAGIIHNKQTSASFLSSPGNIIQREMIVENPGEDILDPATQQSIGRTKGAVMLEYLNRLCPVGSISLQGNGLVEVPDFLCKPIFPFFGAARPADFSSTPTSCSCLCDLEASPNKWLLRFDDARWPHTSWANQAAADTPGVRSGGSVVAPSPVAPLIYGAINAKGERMDIEPWLILGHELCGHAWLGDRGIHHTDRNPARGRGGHQTTITRENLLRREHQLMERGDFLSPYCGESYSYDRGQSPAPNEPPNSSYVAECANWRKEFNHLNGTNFSLQDFVTISPGAQLPNEPAHHHP